MEISAFTLSIIKVLWLRDADDPERWLIIAKLIMNSTSQWYYFRSNVGAKYLLGLIRRKKSLGHEYCLKMDSRVGVLKTYRNYLKLSQ